MPATIVMFMILFWLPVVVVAVFNLLWDLHFWQSVSYRFDLLFQQLRWDFEPSHRRLYLFVVKAILILLVFTYFIAPSSLVAATAIILSYSLWVNDALTIVDQLTRFHLPKVHLHLRAWAIVLLHAALILFVVVGSNYLLFPKTITVISVYRLIVVSTLLGFVLDLGSALLTFLWVIVSSPLVWVYRKQLETRWQNMREAMPALGVVAIVGGQGKSTISHLVSTLAAPEIQSVSGNALTGDLTSVLENLLARVRSNINLAIVDLNQTTGRGLANSVRVLKPQLLVLTGSNHMVEHTLTKDGQERLIREIIAGLPDGARVIYNGDDELLVTLAGKLHNQEVFYYHSSDPHVLMPDNDLEINFIRGRDVTVGAAHVKFQLITPSLDIPVTAPAHSELILSSVLASFAVCAELGMPLSEAATRFEGLELPADRWINFAGDFDSTLHQNPARTSLHSFHYDLQRLQKLPGDRILVTGGIKRLGRNKVSHYHSIAEQIAHSAKVVITTDRTLANALKELQSAVELCLVSNTFDLIYEIRRRLEPGDHVLVHSEVDPYVLNQLRSA